MTDVFISYASEDRDRAEKLASALGAFGWSVWWDRKIITGQAFDQAIERELETAKSVVVLWSEHSIASEWVKNEAAVASERAVLVPAIIESVKLPLEFRRTQTADLIGWKGEPSHSGFQALCEGVATRIGGAPPQQPILGQGQKLRWNPRWALAAITTIAVAVGLGVYSIGPWRATTPTPIPQGDRSEASITSASKEPLNPVALPTPSVTGSRSPKVRVAGEWQADVVYAWNTGTPGNVVNERFSLTTDASGQNIQGSVSLLGKSYVIHDGKVDGNSVTFKTHGRESRGTGEPPLDVTYQYRGTVAGDTMSVNIFAEGAISNYSPVIKFVARRMAITKQQ